MDIAGEIEKNNFFLQDQFFAPLVTKKWQEIHIVTNLSYIWLLRKVFSRIIRQKNSYTS